MSDQLLRVFERLGTTDFEEVIRALQRASQILPIYLDTPETVARLTADAESLKASLITRLLTFAQALDKASGYSKRHLLLGNGFSIACEPTIFTYGSL
jgi:hypothetical protein